MKQLAHKSLMVTLLLLAGVSLIFSSSNPGYSSGQKEGAHYTCPMPEHSDVVMDNPGKCPKCGTELVKKEPAAAKYTCSMKEDADVVMDKPGRCPKCGMDLVPMKKEGK